MEHGPVPPHERSWRHPSELAADELAVLRADEVPRSTRTFAIATGTLGLIALAVFVLAMTPSRGGAPIAISATTTEAAASASTAVPSIAAVRGPVADLTATRLALATPIGSGEYAVVVRAAIDPVDRDRVRVVLPSGRVVTGHLVDDDQHDETALIALAAVGAVHEPGHEVAERRPHDRDVVTVLASPPITVALADIVAVDVADGTPVFDDEGDLIGLCSRGADGTELLIVDDDMGGSVEDDTTDSTSPVDGTSEAPDTSAAGDSAPTTTTTTVTPATTDATDDDG